jgi:hypothetical protein
VARAHQQLGTEGGRDSVRLGKLPGLQQAGPGRVIQGRCFLFVRCCSCRERNELDTVLLVLVLQFPMNLPLFLNRS